MKCLIYKIDINIKILGGGEGIYAVGKVYTPAKATKGIQSNLESIWHFLLNTLHYIPVYTAAVVGGLLNNHIHCINIPPHKLCKMSF